MTNAGKALAVFVTVAALSFMAFAGAVLLGGPNWFGMSQEMDEYTFTPSTGQDLSWSAKHRPTDTSVGSSGILPQVLLGALKDQQQRLTDRQTKLDQMITDVTQKIAEIEKAQAEDSAALEARTKEFGEMLAQLNAEIAQTQKDLGDLTRKTNAINRQLKLRTEDEYRLKSLLALLRTDHERLVDQKGELTDILILLEGGIERLQRRKSQLQQSLSPSSS